MSENTENNVSIYFKSLTLENVKCFKGEHKINFTDKNGNWAKWTVILGNNNTGKTTILKVLEYLKMITYKNEEREIVSRLRFKKPNFFPLKKNYEYLYAPTFIELV